MNLRHSSAIYRAVFEALDQSSLRVKVHHGRPLPVATQLFAVHQYAADAAILDGSRQLSPNRVYVSVARYSGGAEGARKSRGRSLAALATWEQIYFRSWL